MNAQRKGFLLALACASLWALAAAAGAAQGSVAAKLGGEGPLLEGQTGGSRAVAYYLAVASRTERRGGPESVTHLAGGPRYYFDGFRNGGPFVGAGIAATSRRSSVQTETAFYVQVGAGYALTFGEGDRFFASAEVVLPLFPPVGLPVLGHGLLLGTGTYF